MRRTALALFLLAAAIGGSWGASTAFSRVLVQVDGNVHDGKEPWDRFVDIRADRLAQRDMHLVVDGEPYTFSQSALGYDLDREQLRREQAEQPRPSPWATLDPSFEPPELPLTFVLDEEKARSTIESLARAVHREPVDARVLVREHQVIQAQAGLSLDVDGTLELLRRTVPAEDALLEVPTHVVEPRVTDDMVLPIDVSKVLATYETNFKKKAGARAVNIATAARYLDQTILAPGEVFSFNRVVGERSHERGFIDAPVIVNDEMEKDVGGGVCQVASTLHAAAIFGNLEIVQRRSHSRPSGYAPLGLDATVIDGIQDLRIKNPYDTPLLVHAYLPSQYVIRIELLGREPSAQVNHAYAVKDTQPFSRRIWRRADVPEKKGFEQKQDGSPGYEVVSSLTVRHADGKVERRSYPSRYYPVPEVFWVRPQFDLTKLPPLPKGVTEVVVDGGSAAPVGETFDVL